MCERWWCCFFVSGDCACPKDEFCPNEDEEQVRRDYDDLGDRIYHERIDREICHV